MQLICASVNIHSLKLILNIGCQFVDQDLILARKPIFKLIFFIDTFDVKYEVIGVDFVVLHIT